MGIRVLSTRIIPMVSVPNVWVDEAYGYRALFSYDNGQIDGEDQDRQARTAAFAYAAGPLTGKSVAWIGGGFCYGPRCFSIADCKQTVYEIEPDLAEFCPEGIEFIPGDWSDTLRGEYDVVIFDLGGDVPRERLMRHLTPGGVILPKKDDK